MIRALATDSRSKAAQVRRARHAARLCVVWAWALGQGCTEPQTEPPAARSARAALELVRQQTPPAAPPEQARLLSRQRLASAHQLLGQAENSAYRGDAAAARARYGEARAAYEAAWLARPPNGQALFAAGHCALEQGQSAEARRLFDRALVELEREAGKPVEIFERHSRVDKHVSSSKLLAWSPRDDQLAAAEKNRVGLAAPGRAGSIQLLTAASVRSMRFTADGAFVVTGSDDGQLELWSALDGTLLWSVHTRRSPVTGLAMTPDGQSILTASADGHLEIRSPLDGHQLPGLGAAAPHPWGAGGGLSDIAVSGTGTLLALAGSNDIYLWDLTAERHVGTVGPHDRAPRTVALSEDGELVASTARDGKTRLWHWRSGKLLSVLPGNALFDASVAFLPGRKPTVITSSTRIRIWEATTGQLLEVFGEAHGGELAISPDARRVATMPRPAALTIWSSGSGGPTGQVALPREGGASKVRFCRLGPRVFAFELCAERAAPLP